MKHPDVIILGAGAAGLAAAQILSDRGRSVLMLEGRDRIGGRILSFNDPVFPVPVQLGPEFIHGRPPVTWEIVRKAKLDVVDLPFDHWRRASGHLSRMSDSDAEMEKVMGGLARLGRKDMSFAEYLRQRTFPASMKEACKFAISFVEGFDAADPERISAKSLAEEQEGIADVEEQMQFRLLAGYGALVDWLEKSFDRKRVKIQLGTVVKEIIWQKNRVKIQCERGKRAAVFRGSKLLITAPVGILQLPPETAGALHFTPDIPQKRGAAMQLGSGPIYKVVMKFREAFWESKAAARAARGGEKLRDATFLHSPDAAFPTWWTCRPLRTTVLTGWAGGPKALALSGLSPQKIQRAAIESLADLFGLGQTKISSLLEKHYAYDWAADPFSRGAYSYVAVGGSSARAALARPIERTLFFAGEATDTSGQASTVAGALASGQRAAGEILGLK